MSELYKTLNSPSGRQIKVPTGLFIDGKFVPSISGKTFETVNPATAEPLLSISAAQTEDVDAAVVAARKAFKTSWGRNMPGVERGRLLLRLADLLERDKQELAELESLDGGKPVHVARDQDIISSAACIRYYAGHADKIAGQTLEVDDKKYFTYTRQEPVGVCGQIIPWNYVIMMLAWKIGPALAAGCTVILKPSENTPLTALKICELINEAQFPPGVVNVLPGYGGEAGAAIAAHMGIDKVAFTGSTLTGRKIMSAAANSNLKKVTLELGGKSPNIVFSSADIGQAVNWACSGIFYNAGQDCCAGSRIYVQDTMYDEFVSKMTEAVKNVVVGNPFDESTFYGPQITETQFDKLMGYIESGKSEGAKVTTGGSRFGSKGYFIQPTVFTDVKASMKIVKEEIFGPIVVVGKFTNEEEAIELANDTTYGLAAAVHSNDHSQVIRVTERLEAGTVWVNQYGALYNNVPFGGYKQSGIGRELGAHGLEPYLTTKAVLHNIGDRLDWPIA
ncbi:NAD-aldehyde dehydrogenase [Atractiella rhizophila]|nr:NAD-aldehyde dehydrogenase [Atractiella rhizophila]